MLWCPVESAYTKVQAALSHTDIEGEMAVVRNKQVILRNDVTGFPKESDMELIEGSIILKVPEGSNELLLKNLYLSCDPYMRLKMTKSDAPTSFVSYTPDSVNLSLSYLLLLYLCLCVCS